MFCSYDKKLSCEIKASTKLFHESMDDLPLETSACIAERPVDCTSSMTMSMDNTKPTLTISDRLMNWQKNVEETTTHVVERRAVLVVDELPTVRSRLSMWQQRVEQQLPVPSVRSAPQRVEQEAVPSVKPAPQRMEEEAVPRPAPRSKTLEKISEQSTCVDKAVQIVTSSNVSIEVKSGRTEDAITVVDESGESE